MAKIVVLVLIGARALALWIHATLVTSKLWFLKREIANQTRP